jgi:hypothetical protein
MFNTVADSAGAMKDWRIRLQRDNYMGVDVLKEAYKAPCNPIIAPLSVRPGRLRPSSFIAELNGRRGKTAPFPFALRSTLRPDSLAI